MNSRKNNEYYIKKIITNLEFVVKYTGDLSQKELEDNDLVVSAIMFKLIQVSENSNKLTEDFKNEHNIIPWHALRGMRNLIVHEYGNVDLTIVYDTVKKDIPKMISMLRNIVNIDFD